MKYYMTYGKAVFPNIYVVDGDTYWHVSGGDPQRIEAGEQVDAALSRAYGVPVQARPCLEPGQYYPRVWRPNYRCSPGFPATYSGMDAPVATASVRAASMIQLVSLSTQLEGLFRVLDPHPDNLRAYGHEIRSALILACTEVESHWRAIVAANGALPADGRATTADYVALQAALRLGEYEVVMPSYPGMGSVCPFREWSRLAPTQTLSWYNAYNAVKHDRENKLSQATLGQVVQAVAACAILTRAQFGKLVEDNGIVARVFAISREPQWEPPDCYIEPLQEAGWVPLAFPFEA